MGDSMPGIQRMAGMLGVSSNTVVAALAQLEREDFLKPQGRGRRSQILVPEDIVRPAFRVTILLYDHEDLKLGYVAKIQQRLKEKGHEVSVADRNLMDLGMRPERVARMVKKTKTDAWVILSATQDVLEWFVAQSIPAFALFGRFRPLPMAGTGPDKVQAVRTAVRRLLELGHRRIVLLQPDHMRKPTLALLLREALDEMELQGIKTGSYNLPEWEPTPDGLWRCLDSLFRLSPPTALILDRASEYIGSQQYLAHRGILAPRDVSLICTDDDFDTEWCKPTASCIHWETSPLVRRIVGWAGNVSNGKDDRRKQFSEAKFVERGSVGPAPVRSSPD